MRQKPKNAINRRIARWARELAWLDGIAFNDALTLVEKKRKAASSHSRRKKRKHARLTNKSEHQARIDSKLNELGRQLQHDKGGYLGDAIERVKKDFALNVRMKPFGTNPNKMSRKRKRPRKKKRKDFFPFERSGRRALGDKLPKEMRLILPENFDTTLISKSRLSLIAPIGGLLQALEGSIPPKNAAEEHFVEVLRGRKNPSTEIEMAWMDFMKARDNLIRGRLSGKAFKLPNYFDVGSFTANEQEILASNFHITLSIAKGELAPLSDTERRFARVMKGELEPESDEEKIWLKFRATSAEAWEAHRPSYETTAQFMDDRLGYRPGQA